MLNRRPILFLFLVFWASGCTIKPVTSLPAQSTNQTKAPFSSHVITTHWDIGQNPVLSHNGFLLDVFGIVLTGNTTNVFISLSGITIADLVSQEILQISDNNNLISPLISAITITQQGDLALGLLEFEARRSGASMLNLQLIDKSSPDISIGTVVVTLHGQPSDDDFYSIFSTLQTEPTDRGGSRISLIWLLPSEAQNAEAQQLNKSPVNTPKPHPLATVTPAPTIALMPLPPGVFIQRDASFRIEDLKSGLVSYVGVQLLSDGNAWVLNNGNVSQPQPILVAPPTPTSEPYPSAPLLGVTPPPSSETYP
jgi:hypothetical protein